MACFPIQNWESVSVKLGEEFVLERRQHILVTGEFEPYAKGRLWERTLRSREHSNNLLFMENDTFFWKVYDGYTVCVSYGTTILKHRRVLVRGVIVGWRGVGRWDNLSQEEHLPSLLHYHGEHISRESVYQRTVSCVFLLVQSQTTVIYPDHINNSGASRNSSKSASLNCHQNVHEDLSRVEVQRNRHCPFFCV